MSSIGQSCGADPRLLGRESLDVRHLQPKSQRQELQASEKAENKAVEEVLPTAPTRFSGLLGGAWQKVRTMFRRSSGRADATEEEPEAESIGDYTASAVNPESYPASLPGDFRILPASAWQSLHARFEQETKESSTEVAATAPANAPSSPTSHHAEGADAADLEKSEETDMPDARLNYTSLIKLQYCSFGSHDVSNFSTRAEL
eukprot:s3163_g14.t1